jgi:Phage tail lysozyme
MSRLWLLALLALSACTQSVDVIEQPDDPADVDPPDPAKQPATSEPALSNAEQSAFNYFVSKGLTDIQSAGIVGNLIQESSVIPSAVEYGGGPGRGIAQWSVGGRWDSSHNDNVTTYANQQGVSRWALATQLDFIWYELTTFSGYGLAQLKAATTVSAATVAFMAKFEICGTCNQTGRVSYANQVLAAYGGSGGGGGGSDAGCYSGTLAEQMPANACVQSKFDNLWYQCSNGSWVDRWSDPTACNGVHPL